MFKKKGEKSVLVDSRWFGFTTNPVPWNMVVVGLLCAGLRFPRRLCLAGGYFNATLFCVRKNYHKKPYAYFFTRISFSMIGIYFERA